MVQARTSACIPAAMMADGPYRRGALIAPAPKLMLPEILTSVSPS
ncbi:hypothetical protein MES4922_30164 [Mesorhizobium ventifaucium]|uniref:Propionyl-coenzyme A carboxylase alpha polypeptide n=1 Tax=Mesorhizobium ventifaucium TaxID=666020 RepID=A0ABN8JXF8_9HYPH|nr:hypothetical protein MES4922_30164 [Mesorhizobium ventifaucium]